MRVPMVRAARKYMAQVIRTILVPGGTYGHELEESVFHTDGESWAARLGIAPGQHAEATFVVVSY